MNYFSNNLNTEYMDIKEAILHRRLISPDDFNSKIIDDITINEMLTCADWAPTHGYTEPWRFIIYTKDKIASFCKDHADLYKKYTASEKFTEANFNKIASRGDLASHLIVCYNKRGSNPKISQHEEICATAIAIQNLWLYGASKNVGLYWGTGGMVHHICMKEYFQLAPEDVMMGLLFVGYTDKEWPKGKRVTPIEDKVIWK